jgi:O-antigen/teichoic acid export membrane protein
VLFSFASFFLGFFGPDFLFWVWTLRILLVYQLINVLTWFWWLILNHWWYEKTYSRILLYCAFLNILLNYLFIPTWWIIWAALSTAISFNLANFIVVYYNKKLLGVTSHFNWFRL